jgi:5-methyltetrahydrofolate--homocysteine methyltransferase
MERNERISRLRELIEQKILVLDGAMGTTLQDLELSADDFGGEIYEGCNEYLNITRPHILQDIHKKFFESGADMVETNSFGSTPLVLAEYSLEDKAEEISRLSAQNARIVADEYSTEDRPRFVIGSMGPTTKAISVTGGISWDDLAENYRVQARGLITGGADVLLLETSQDTLNVKAGIEGIDRACIDTGIEIPVSIQCTIETMGTMLGGQDIESFYTSIAHRDLLWVGFNCATGPEFMRDHVRTLAAISRFPVAVIPNAGLPDEDGNYHETPEKMAQILSSFISEGWINIIGGCCGTSVRHIDQMCSIATVSKPRTIVYQTESKISGLETVVINDDSRPILIGERTNVLGSRRFKRLIAEDKIEEASEVGRQQVRGGAHLLDICLQDPDREEMDDMITFLDALTRKTKAPLVIDSTDSNVIEEALKRTPGKSLINSINLENGEERFAEVVPLAKRFGAALVVGCIDDDVDQAQAITKERKLEIAIRSYNLLTQKYGIPPEDIIFDPLVFPVGTGDKNYIGSAVETIEAIRMIKKELPLTKTVLGISNVSFGLPASGREVLNAVMLYHCVKAGLDSAIVNTQSSERYASISLEERKLAEDLIWWRGDDPIAAFADHFRERKVKVVANKGKKLSLDERIASCVIEGTKEGLIDDLRKALEKRKALEIINGPLMKGMDEVGRLFASNELIVAEVLGSAEVMKAAVSYLEDFMELGDSHVKGNMLLATVKGDVHDIGKNLVDIIFSNNGYHVINLGIKVPPQEIVKAFNENKPDMIGLSGLLVKSAQMMVDTVKDLKQSGIDVPILVGGAALSNRFTRLRIAPNYDGITLYAPDAMTGLRLANSINNDENKEKVTQELMEEADRLLDSERKKKLTGSTSNNVSTAIPLKQVDEIPTPPDLTTHNIVNYELEEIFSYINPTMLYVRHLGFRGRFLDLLDKKDPKAIELYEKVNAVQNIMLQRDDINAKAVYKFFPARSEGDDLLLMQNDFNTELARFKFGRQEASDKRCLTDYISSAESKRVDYIGAFVTNIGPGVRSLANEWNENGDYLNSHILQSLALESAEAFAELLHQKMRAMWSITDREGIAMDELFKTQYHGKRFSFGYPACPRLEDQATLWKLLEPEKNIQVQLTEEFMMDPEASVSALVFHHPEAKYFNLSDNDLLRLESRIASESENS